MKELNKIFKKIKSKLHLAAKTKLTKSRLDRGGGEIFTKRRKRNDIVLIPFETFTNSFKSDVKQLSIYEDGYYILCSPEEYYNNSKILENVPSLRYYQSKEDVLDFPFLEEDITKKDSNGKIIGNVVVNIMDLNKHSKKTEYKGVKLIGQNAYDYATHEEQDYVEYSLLYQMIRMEDFNGFFENDFLSLVDKFVKLFENSELYLDNPRLIENTSNGTKCPVLKKKLLYFDIINGTIKGDLGRNNNNRTVTKINLHHIDRLINGKLNHNHKNVFLGTAAGNTIDSALINENMSLCDFLLTQVCARQYDENLMQAIRDIVNK